MVGTRAYFVAIAAHTGSFGLLDNIQAAPLVSDMSRSSAGSKGITCEYLFPFASPALDTTLSCCEGRISLSFVTSVGGGEPSRGYVDGGWC
jgi:hypothetical protein